MRIPQRNVETKVQVTLRVTRPQRERLRQLAAQSRVPMSRALEYAVERLLADADAAEAAARDAAASSDGGTQAPSIADPENPSPEARWEPLATTDPPGRE